MNAGDVLMKKWCFGMGRSKAREEAVQGANGEVNTYVTYPKYRTIVFKVDSANKNGEEWTSLKRMGVFTPMGRSGLS